MDFITNINKFIKYQDSQDPSYSYQNDTTDATEFYQAVKEHVRILLNERKTSLTYKLELGKNQLLQKQKI